jgi:hypothetical protein
MSLLRHYGEPWRDYRAYGFRRARGHQRAVTHPGAGGKVIDAYAGRVATPVDDVAVRAPAFAPDLAHCDGEHPDETLGDQAGECGPRLEHSDD